MSESTVRHYLERFGRSHDIRVFAQSSATVELAAQAVGCEPARIAKTLSLYSQDGNAAVLIVAAGDARINSGDFKRAFGYKARFLQSDDVARLTGHEPGGVCPFANPESATIYLDESLRRFETVYPAAGSANSAIELTLSDLEELSNAAGWVSVARLPLG
ncbi:YbaK/EbsC family protein [Rarobacter incanus]|uniref:Prolyl-tRNA editing enzyme YbaK/EbsC (Cys-tRNA(Pro) deacylase) n=1 Tax=Rarobacter incanus TaxID=153494 RepID=A0A542SPQ2_9MICO|nr:YbaK/EbsC family protein [Rarobacter incanus]TQK76596.1 prolyl-tRNA editing enzyme YbaK/EbsC (Cys-tRNA(Pro) deacylase) [Rarobacter incanus]